MRRTISLWCSISIQSLTDRLFISKELRTDFFELTKSEREDLLGTIDGVRAMLDLTCRPDGYNIGMNCGEVAGQTVMHFHCHVIPRYAGDMTNPAGRDNFTLLIHGDAIRKLAACITSGTSRDPRLA